MSIIFAVNFFNYFLFFAIENKKKLAIIMDYKMEEPFSTDIGSMSLSEEFAILPLVMNLLQYIREGRDELELTKAVCLIRVYYT